MFNLVINFFIAFNVVSACVVIVWSAFGRYPKLKTTAWIFSSIYLSKFSWESRITSHLSARLFFSNKSLVLVVAWFWTSNANTFLAEVSLKIMYHYHSPAVASTTIEFLSITSFNNFLLNASTLSIIAIFFHIDYYIV